MKKQYYQPTTRVHHINLNQNLLDNSFNGDNATLDPETMDEGDGSDAGAKGYGSFNVWED